MIQFRRLLIAALAIPLVTVPDVKARDVRMLERFNVGGYIEVPGPAPCTFLPHPSPRPLPRADDTVLARRGNDRAARDAEFYMLKFPATTGLMFIDRGKIVFEAYQGMGIGTA